MPTPVSLYNLSLKYLDGLGVAKDLEKAFLLNEESAASGFGEAVLAMGWFYLNGYGVEKDLRKAERWYRKSAKQGDARAMFSLGQMAYDTRRFDDAMVWFTRAMSKGHSRSIFWVGKLHWHGRGVEQDKKHAMALFQQASRERVPEARRALRLLSKWGRRGER